MAIPGLWTTPRQPAPPVQLPCINAGNNAYVSSGPDLDGRPRIVGGTVDMGAYEFQGAGMGEFIGWLQTFSLPTDGSADFTDSDNDHLENWQEWRCRTDPTSEFSVLRLLPPAPAGGDRERNLQSVAGVNYVLERSTNLGASPPLFTILATNLPASPARPPSPDTNVVGEPPRFYRVRVIAP